MSAEYDFDLTPNQWEVLKALRLPASKRRVQSRFVIDGLVALQLAAIADDGPRLTEMGRKVLVRGSSRLLDLVA